MKRAILISSIGVAWSIFQLLTSRFILLDPILLRSAHLSFALTLTFLMRPFSKRMPRNIGIILDALFVLLSSTIGLYIFLNYDRILWHTRMVSPVFTTDVIFALMAIFLAFEAARRTVGWPLPVIAFAFLVYSYIGPIMPGLLHHGGFSVWEILEFQFLGTTSLFGIPIGVSATFVYLFILFAAFLDQIGGGRFFVDLAFAATGRTRGGPAKASIVGSCLVGTITGSGSANVVATGIFTIPLMKKVGYKPHFAGAVEAVASTGGMIMPPVMGSAAFIMAEFLGVSYWSICVAAAIPALLYYFALYFMVDLEAARTGLKGLPSEALPKVKGPLLQYGHITVPLIILVYLLANGFTPITAASAAIVATVLVGFLRKATRLGPKGILKALEKGAVMATVVGVSTACSGIVLGTVLHTGLGLKFTSLLITISGGNLLPALILVAIGSFILGMGMGTTAVYVTVAALMVPALISMGIEPIVAHMFVFYFAIIALYTPPVCTATYVAAGIAKSEPLRTGLTATRLGLAGLIVPFMFVYGPSLLFIGPPYVVLWSFFTATVGVFCLAAGIIGFLLRQAHLIERILLLSAAVALIHPGVLTDIYGFAVLAIIMLRQGAIAQVKSLLKRPVI